MTCLMQILPEISSVSSPLYVVSTIYDSAEGERGVKGDCEFMKLCM